jgi:hypothetical protein
VIEPGRLEAVLAMADALDTDNERRSVVQGYANGGYDDLVRDADAAWSALVIAEALVTRERWRCGPEGTWVFRDGEEI